MRNVLHICVMAGLLCSFVASATFAQDAPASQPAAAEPAPYAKLKAALPDTFNGLKRSKTTGEKTAMGEMKLSRAAGEYGEADAADGKTARIEVMDYAGMPAILTSLAGWASMNIDNDSDTESTKTMKLGDCPALETIRKESQHAETVVMVAKRFMITIVAEKADVEAYRAAVKAIDFKKFEAAAK